MKNDKWVDSIVEAFNELDDFQGNLTKDIYERVYRIRQSRNLTLGNTYDSFKATVRQIIESFSKDSDNFLRANHPNIFSIVGKKGSGNWKLNEEYRNVKTFNDKPLENEDVSELVHIKPILLENNEDDLAVSEDGKQLASIEEVKIRKEHYLYEGRLKASQIKKIKSIKGYICEACGLSFAKKYPGLGMDFIECHHKIPYADVVEGEYRELNIDDFMVLCSNCHAMIHRLDDPADLEQLKAILAKGSEA